MSIVNLVGSQNKIEVLCAGRHQKCNEILNQLFTRLSVTAELVFFIDGFIKDSKFLTWVKRQDQKYRKSLLIMDEVRKSSLSDVVKYHSRDIYTNTFLNVIENVCCKYGSLHYTMNFECDQEIARFAFLNPRVLAVFSNDTDFLIFPGVWRYFSTKDLDLDLLTTLEFDRQKLSKHLRLTSSQMPVFATLAGNDIVDREGLERFHNKFGKRVERKFEGLANFIRQHTKNFSSFPEMIEFFATEVYGFPFKDRINLLENSIKSYSMNLKTEDNPYSKYVLNKNIFTFKILNRSPINFSLVFFDLRQSDMPSYFNLCVSMFQRQAGIVLMNSDNRDEKLTLYTKQNHNTGHRKVKVKAIFPPFEIPELDDLYSFNPDLDAYRFALLKWTISWEGLKDVELRDFPDNYMIDILTILFMLRSGVITSKEADIFLWTVKNVEKGTVPASLKPPRFVEPRAFRLAFLYVKLFVNVVRSIEVCGLKSRYWVSFYTS